VKASSMDAFFDALVPHKGELPVLESEIGTAV
jgi:hypothetical protein